MPTKLLQNINARSLGRVRPGQVPHISLLNVTEEFNQITPYGFEEAEYRVGVTLSQRVWIRDETQLAELHRMVSERIAREVYGEVYDKLYELQEAVFNRDDESTRRIIEEMRELMRP